MKVPNRDVIAHAVCRMYASLQRTHARAALDVNLGGIAGIGHGASATDASMVLDGSEGANNEPTPSDTRSVILCSGPTWRAVKVFTASLCAGDNPIGEQFTAWLRTSPGVVVEVVLAQSGACDAGCFSFIAFYRPHARTR
jgi:hypothetical protein